MGSLCTIGHSSHSFEHFAGLLHQHRIATLVDVRSRPYSRFVPHFQKRLLDNALTAEGLTYVFLGDKLGGKLGARYRDPSGSLDYQSRAREPDFQEGIHELLAIAEDKTTAIMCAEDDPSHCHRRLLITPALVEAGVKVFHIRGDGTVEAEAQLARRASSQLSLF